MDVKRTADMAKNSRLSPSSDQPITDRAGSEKLFCEWFGIEAGRRVYRRFSTAFPKRGKGWAHTHENLRPNVMHWSGIRDTRSWLVSAGNEQQPPGEWVDASEHTTAILHVGFLRYLPVIALPKEESIPCAVARSRMQAELGLTTPRPIDGLAAKVGGKDGR